MLLSIIYVSSFQTRFTPRSTTEVCLIPLPLPSPPLPPPPPPRFILMFFLSFFLCFFSSDQCNQTEVSDIMLASVLSASLPLLFSPDPPLPSLPFLFPSPLLSLSPSLLHPLLQIPTPISQEARCQSMSTRSLLGSLKWTFLTLSPLPHALAVCPLFPLLLPPLLLFSSFLSFIFCV